MHALAFVVVVLSTAVGVNGNHRDDTDVQDLEVRQILNLFLCLHINIYFALWHSLMVPSMLLFLFSSQFVKQLEFYIILRLKQLPNYYSANKVLCKLQHCIFQTLWSLTSTHDLSWLSSFSGNGKCVWRQTVGKIVLAFFIISILFTHKVWSHNSCEMLGIFPICDQIMLLSMANTYICCFVCYTTSCHGEPSCNNRIGCSGHQLLLWGWYWYIRDLQVRSYGQQSAIIIPHYFTWN